MQSTLETLQAEVMRLSPADRAKLLDSLITSLDIDADVEAEWDELADRREYDLESGAAEGIPLEVGRVFDVLLCGRVKGDLHPEKRASSLATATSSGIALAAPVSRSCSRLSASSSYAASTSASISRSEEHTSELQSL